MRDIHVAAALGLALTLAATVPAVAASRLPDGYEDVLVVEGLSKPTSLAFATDGRIFVAEQEGRLRVIVAGELLPTPFVSLAVDASIERGLLGVLPALDFATSGHVYVYYTHRDGPRNRVSRFTASRAQPNVADPASELVLLDGIPSAPFHNGGALRFLPDGTMLVAVGDAEVPESAASLGTLTGKLLRIDTAGRVPPDNPFASDPNARGEIWAYGLRNPFTFAVEPGTGRVHINDVGLAAIEEINLGIPGANYGWPGCEGPCNDPAVTPPLHFYNHSQGCAVTGGAFSAGLTFPAEMGGYFFSDFCGRWIARLTPEGEALEFARDMDHDAVDITAGPDGSLYYVSYTGGVLRRIAFVGSGNHSPRAAATATPAAGPAPLMVVLSADGTHDPDGDPLSVHWDPGDASVPLMDATVTHSYARNGVYVARVVVEDGRGGRDTAAARVFVGNPPSASIQAPAEGARFRSGQVIAYSGSATDPETGPVPADRLVWNIELHHHAEGDPLHHTHPVQGPVFGASGSFQVPESLHSDDIFFRVTLTATDPDGLPGSAHRDIHTDHDS